jgi:hypothetical protein
MIKFGLKGSFCGFKSCQNRTMVFQCYFCHAALCCSWIYLCLYLRRFTAVSKVKRS